MHQCLRVPELATLIVEASVPTLKDRGHEGLDKHDRNTLYVLAQTCRELQEPALDVLWYYQVGFRKLLSLLPRGYVEMTRREAREWFWSDSFLRREVVVEYLEVVSLV